MLLFVKFGIELKFILKLFSGSVYYCIYYLFVIKFLIKCCFFE